MENFGQNIVRRIKSFKLPSRNQSIFLGTTGTIASLLIYDHQSVSAIQADLMVQASKIANEPAVWNSKSRKIKVFFDSTYWPQYWFNDFAKPILDAGAIDYEIIEGKDPVHVISSARELVWDAKEQNEYESKSQEYENRYNNRGWFSWTGGLSNSEIKVLQQKFDDDSAKNFNPLVYQPKFDQSIGIIAVGPRAWRHMLAGLQFGLYSAVPAHRYTGDNQTEASSDATNIVLPTVGFIASVDRSGFSKFFYRRSIGWFTKRFMAKEIGTQALAIVLGNTREIKPEDLELGIDTFEDWPQKEEPDEKDLEIQSWIERGDWIQLEPSFIQKLQIYTQ